MMRSLATTTVVFASVLVVCVDARLQLPHKWTPPRHLEDANNANNANNANANNNGYNYQNANNYAEEYSNQYNNANYNQNGYWNAAGEYIQDYYEGNYNEQAAAAEEEEEAAEGDAEGDAYYDEEDEDAEFDAESDAPVYDDDGLHLEQYTKYLEVHSAMEAFRLATILLCLVIAIMGGYIAYLRRKVRTLLRQERSLLNSMARIEK